MIRDKYNVSEKSMGASIKTMYFILFLHLLRHNMYSIHRTHCVVLEDYKTISVFVLTRHTFSNEEQFDI